MAGTAGAAAVDSRAEDRGRQRGEADTRGAQREHSMRGGSSSRPMWQVHRKIKSLQGGKGRRQHSELGMLNKVGLAMETAFAS